ncbi:MAG TPA: TIGR00730 family Rossman fold protein [Steroidobacteraceae bacterium]|nr:TIGR00730 family Rossman fold protein [Steroidobacteraceae bacterium]
MSVERPLLAYHDPDFVESDEARPLRIVAEYLQPLRAFRAAHVSETVVFFGSSRLRGDGPNGRYVTEATELARLVTEWSLSMPENGHRLVVCSGGGPGIMEAVNRGASLAGGRSVGLNIGLPHEQRPNPYITPELSFQFHYFFMRKLWFAHLARALVVFPGGFGTFDELFEMLTLAQTRKLDRNMLVLLYGSAFWQEAVNFPALLRHGVIGADDLNLFSFVDTPAEALERLKAGIALEPGADAVVRPAFAKSRHPNGDDGREE